MTSDANISQTHDQHVVLLSIPLFPASPLTAYILLSHSASNSTASTRVRSDGSNELALSGEETDAGHHDTEVGERNDRQAQRGGGFHLGEPRMSLPAMP
jgi:hypothetical protein